MSIKFRINESDILLGVWIIESSISIDSRGSIWTSFLKDEIENLLPNNLIFKHDKFSESKKNVLRGIHGDEKSWKIVTCVFGEIMQVVVDCRPGSKTRNKWQKIELNSKKPAMVLLPPNMGNSYYVRSKCAVYHYKLAYQGDYIDADDQFSVKWNDPRLNIEWPTKHPILSSRDQ